MLFVLSGDVQTGKTRWLQRLVAEVEAGTGQVCGVLAPGVWRDWRSEPRDTWNAHVDANGFEKLGIDNVLLPQGEHVAFARRRDLDDALVPGTSESERAGLSWSIDDEAIRRVNEHFAALRGRVLPEGLLVVDELGRLELEHGGGLVEALRVLDDGPRGRVFHALVVVREALLDKLDGRFAAWGAKRVLLPDERSLSVVMDTLAGEPDRRGAWRGHVARLLPDMHCHLDFADNAVDIARGFERAGLSVWSCSVTPQGYEAARKRFACVPCVRVGLGMHPWWVSEGRVDDEEVGRFAELAVGERYIGEVGLDFGKRYRGSSERQLAAFSQVAEACKDGGKLVSLHAVRSAGTVMDLLEDAGCLEGNDFVFHWFSGSSPELTRAVRLGFYFSVNTMMLGTKRGREYLKAVPANKLLLETDLPEEGAGTVGFSRFEEALADTAAMVAQVRGKDVLEQVAATSKRLLELC